MHSPLLPSAYRICLLAGDISPIDVLTHIPIVCEDRNIPYIYVPSKEVSTSAAAHTTSHLKAAPAGSWPICCW